MHRCKRRGPCSLKALRCDKETSHSLFADAEPNRIAHISLLQLGFRRIFSAQAVSLRTKPSLGMSSGFADCVCIAMT